MAAQSRPPSAQLGSADTAPDEDFREVDVEGELTEDEETQEAVAYESDVELGPEVSLVSVFEQFWTAQFECARGSHRALDFP